MWDLGQVLKHLLIRSNIFSHEGVLESALSVVDRFVAAHVPPAAIRVMQTGEELAMHEDVTLRKPSGHIGQAIVTTGPSIDYNRLANAIIAAQEEAQRQADARNNPPSTPGE